MRFRTRVVTALRNTPLKRPTDWLLYHMVPGAAERRRHHGVDIQTIEFMRSVLSIDSCAIDVGAHVGALLAEIVRIAPQGHHHAVEPLPDLAAALRANFPAVAVHECVVASDAWVSSHGTKATIHRNVDDPGYSSVERTDHPRVKGKTIEEVTVSSSTLDRVIEGSAHIDLVKLDVEGFELQVLQGATELLNSHRPLIVFEHEAVGEAATETASLFALLAEHDYDIERLMDWRNPRALSGDQFRRSYAAGDSYFIGRPRERS
jgi:FkbM family methyltransferase